MTAPPAAVVDRRWFSDADWDEIARRAPRMAGTLRRLVVDLQRTAAAGTVDAAERALRQFAGHVTEVDSRCRSVAIATRRDPSTTNARRRPRYPAIWGGGDRRQ